MQVLEHQHGRVRLGDVLEESAPRREQLLALRRRGRLDPEQGQQRWRNHPLITFGKHRIELCAAATPGVGLEDPGVRLDDLPQRPERDAFAVRQASALAPGDQLRQRVDVVRTARPRSALAHAGLARPP